MSHRSFSTYKELNNGAVDHFSNMLQDLDERNIGKIMKVIHLFPQIFHQEDNVSINYLISLEQVKYVI